MRLQLTKKPIPDDLRRQALADIEAYIREHPQNHIAAARIPQVAQAVLARAIQHVVTFHAKHSPMVNGSRMPRDKAARKLVEEFNNKMFKTELRDHRCTIYKDLRQHHIKPPTAKALVACIADYS